MFSGSGEEECGGGVQGPKRKGVQGSWFIKRCIKYYLGGTVSCLSLSPEPEKNVDFNVKTLDRVESLLGCKDS